jgi:glycerol-3-phosphate dehydrogenase
LAGIGAGIIRDPNRLYRGMWICLGRIMSDDIYDLAVIGGGINGCGIARDAAGRGANVILFERGDLARGTSSASTKLIHGGLRYLEHYEFALVRESLIERERLWKIAPHIIWPMRFVLPYQKGLRPKWMLRAGLFMYDHIGGRKKLPTTRSLNLTKEPAGAALNPSFTSGFEYSDCWVDDARMVVLNALDAAEHGATIKLHSEVTSLRREDGVWHIETHGKQPVRARAVVNAAGPAVLDILKQTTGHHGNPNEKIRLVRGSHIVVPKMFDSPQAYFCQNPDGRIFFAIPYEDDFTLVGTTDADHHGSLDNVHATAEEIAYLCTSAGTYFRKVITPDDVVHSYAGVRPLVDDGSGKPESASRGYRFDVDDEAGSAPLLSVYGGKITTYRHLSESAIKRLAPYLPILAGEGWTAEKPLPGGDFMMDGQADLVAAFMQEYPFLPEITARRYVRHYGTRARRFLGTAQSLADLGHDFGYGLSQNEVDYLVGTEWARNADDILWRRSKLGLRLSAAQTNKLDEYIAAKN